MGQLDVLKGYVTAWEYRRVSGKSETLISIMKNRLKFGGISFLNEATIRTNYQKQKSLNKALEQFYQCKQLDGYIPTGLISNMLPEHKSIRNYVYRAIKRNEVEHIKFGSNILIKVPDELIEIDSKYIIYPSLDKDLDYKYIDWIGIRWYYY